MSKRLLLYLLLPRGSWLRLSNGIMPLESVCPSQAPQDYVLVCKFMPQASFRSFQPLSAGFYIVCAVKGCMKSCGVGLSAAEIKSKSNRTIVISPSNRQRPSRRKRRAGHAAGPRPRQVCRQATALFSAPSLYMGNRHDPCASHAENITEYAA